MKTFQPCEALFGLDFSGGEERQEYTWYPDMNYFDSGRVTEIAPHGGKNTLILQSEMYTLAAKPHHLFVQCGRYICLNGIA